MNKMLNCHLHRWHTFWLLVNHLSVVCFCWSPSSALTRINMKSPEHFFFFQCISTQGLAQKRKQEFTSMQTATKIHNPLKAILPTQFDFCRGQGMPYNNFSIPPKHLGLSCCVPFISDFQTWTQQAPKSQIH